MDGTGQRREHPLYPEADFIATTTLAELSPTHRTTITSYCSAAALPLTYFTIFAFNAPSISLCDAAPHCCAAVHS